MNLTEDTKKIISLFDENKLLILKALFKCEDEPCGCDLIERLDMPKSLLSYHIKTLEVAGIIEESRCGRNKKYRIVESQKLKVKNILEIVELI
jgi:ArsR family transcriptional regulator